MKITARPLLAFLSTCVLVTLLFCLLLLGSTRISYRSKLANHLLDSAVELNNIALDIQRTAALDRSVALHSRAAKLSLRSALRWIRSTSAHSLETESTYFRPLPTAQLKNLIEIEHRLLSTLQCIGKAKQPCTIGGHGGVEFFHHLRLGYQRSIRSLVLTLDKENSQDLDWTRRLSAFFAIVLLSVAWLGYRRHRRSSANASISELTLTPSAPAPPRSYNFTEMLHSVFEEAEDYLRTTKTSVTIVASTIPLFIWGDRELTKKRLFELVVIAINDSKSVYLNVNVTGALADIEVKIENDRSLFRLFISTGIEKHK